MFTTDKTKLARVNFVLGTMDLALAYYLNDVSIALCALLCYTVVALCLFKHS